MLLKKRKKVLSLLAAMVMTLSISSVALAAGFNTLAGDGVFRQYLLQSDPTLTPTQTNNRYEAEVEATLTQTNMFLNLDIDYIGGMNPIRQISISNANLALVTAVEPSELNLGEYAVEYNPTDPKATYIYAKVEATVYIKGETNPTQQEVMVLLANNTNVWPTLGVKDVIGIMFANAPDPSSSFILIGGKSAIQLSNQNAQGGQNQQ
jgi:hypothetical protein